mgnify:CR=1 FL=1
MDVAAMPINPPLRWFALVEVEKSFARTEIIEFIVEFVWGWDWDWD